jgi:hypothetical protein
MFSQSHFSVMKWNKIKSKTSFGKRKSSSFKCNKNQVKSLHNEEATSILQTLAKTNTYGMICTFLFTNGSDLILRLTYLMNES